MRIVNDWGELYRMSERSYRRYLRAGADGKEPEASEYGRHIGMIAFHSIDAKTTDYQDALDALKVS